MFYNIIEDVDVFSGYLGTLVEKSTFSNSPDVMNMNKNIDVMKQRFDSYVTAYGTVTKKKKKKKEPVHERPVVVD
jgi:hypothetical protein